MLNNDVVLATAATLATKTTAESDRDQQRIASLYQALFGRPATTEERDVAMQIIRRSRETRKKLAAAGEKDVDAETGPWEDLCVAMMCSNGFLYVD